MESPVQDERGWFDGVIANHVPEKVWLQRLSMAKCSAGSSTRHQLTKTVAAWRVQRENFAA